MRLKIWLPALALLCIAVFLVFELVQEQTRRRRDASSEKEFVRILASAKSPEDLEEASGYLGVLLRIPDGSWIAIHYQDSHVLPIWSFAVALDSDGNWFQSSKHFCGRFRSYRDQKKNLSEVKELSLDEKKEMVRDPDLQAIENADNLKSARQVLEKMGFCIFNSPVQPAFGGRIE